MRQKVYTIFLSILLIASANAQLDNKQQEFLDVLSSGNVDSLQLLIDKGLDVNSPIVFLPKRKNPLKYHPLFFVKTHDVAELLIKYGAFVNARDTGGNTPLHTAAQNGGIDIASLLLKNGAKPNLKGSYGRTPLYVAAMEEDLKMVRLLVESGADLNAQVGNGMTILHHAVIESKLEIVEFALEQCIDSRIEDENGLTALQWALRISRTHNEDFLKIISLLKKYEKNYG